MMTCRTGKRCFETEAIAEEALIQNHIVNHYQGQEGPKTIYQCDECGNWHFTSRGQFHPLFEDEEVVDRIKRERLANSWERHLR